MRLKRELQSWREADAERFAAVPGVARFSTFELVTPGTGSVEETELVERVNKYIASAFGVEVGLEEAGGSAPIDAAVGQIVFQPDDSARLPDLRGLAAGEEFFWPGFPAGSDDYDRMDTGRYYDRANDRIWIETAETGVFRALVPPPGFDPDLIDDYVGIVPEAGSLPGPSATPATQEPAADLRGDVERGATIDAAAAVPRAPGPPPALAYTIYEETSGRGTVLIGNLTPADPGMVYQLWMRNSFDDQPVSVGLLPALGEEAERFEFDLLGPGIAPGATGSVLRIENCSARNEGFYRAIAALPGAATWSREVFVGIDTPAPSPGVLDFEFDTPGISGASVDAILHLPDERIAIGGKLAIGGSFTTPSRGFSVLAEDGSTAPGFLPVQFPSARVRAVLPLLDLWMKDGEVIPGASTPSLSLDRVAPEQSGIYQVHVTDSTGGAASTPVRVKVIPPLPGREDEFTCQTKLHARHAVDTVTQGSTSPSATPGRRMIANHAWIVYEEVDSATRFVGNVGQTTGIPPSGYFRMRVLLR